MTEWTQSPEPYSRFAMPEDCDFDGPGVYTYSRGSGQVYVGMTHSLSARLGDHRRAGMLTVITDGSLYPTATNEAAARLERALIWLLDPSENDRRPSPSGPLWAATLGHGRPVDEWRWYQSCGHVKVNGRVLASTGEVATAGCSCKPWRRWLEHARAFVEGQEARRTVDRVEVIRLQAQLEEAESLRDHLAWLEEQNAELLEHCERMDERYDRAMDEIARLEALRERANWP